ncbi:MAG: TadE/TadG family type IV pilus assembly protein [Alphaproteobacteria bacterium]|nr:TadE/TadG family type IV pilus assembly protein [Alphaproteobacteria bacterium]
MKKRSFLSFWSASDGASAVEFALIAPVLLLMTIGIIEISLMMLTQNIMESVTFTASRLGKTGYVEAGITREETIIQALHDAADGLLDTTKITVDTQSYNEFGDVGSPEPFVDANGNGIHDDGENYTDVNANGQYDTDMGAAGEGNAGQVVVYIVTYPWSVSTPLLSSLMGDHGVFSLTARAVVKNEPFE